MTSRTRKHTGGVTLIVVCVLALTVGRYLYGSLSVAQAKPAPTGSGSAVAKAPMSQYGPPAEVGVLEDPLIVESSGLVASRAQPGSFWTHNDSGGYEPYLFCVRDDASSCGRWTIPGANAIDWEDIAAGPGPVENRSYLYIGDIGDNARSRSSVQVYRVPEPTKALSAMTSSVTEEATTLELTYPNGSHDAETLMVHPVTGDIYIVTKERSSRAGVYKASPPFASHTVLEKVARFNIPDHFSQRTGGDISPDGTRLIVSTYLGAYEKVAPPGDFDLIWRTPAAKVDLGSIKQREGIAYGLDGSSIFATSEGAHTKLVSAVRR